MSQFLSWIDSKVVVAATTIGLSAAYVYYRQRQNQYHHNHPSIVFITGNNHKLECFETFVDPELKQYIIMDDVEDQDEIQEISSMKVIKQKIYDALINIDHSKYDINETIIVIEDVSLSLQEYDNKLPGPLVKWFINKDQDQNTTNSAKYILKMLQHPTADRSATAMCLYACIPLNYINHKKQNIFGAIKVFKGVCKGQITHKQLGNGPGYSSVFKPDGYDQTYAEMGVEQSRSCSMHAEAIGKLSIYLKQWIKSFQ